ncbi:hypothetical protein FEM48_Zijuj01G0151100 [Ziziphus jujuba var. spinosa]|uniref:Splicing factor U2af large subunit n=1 Tax=Ziziphus jujuba var. spinosa TaxID=714518 RepID=A0A978W1Z1_ZIZJJ|nr:hypothetical protein FEM48_Zijuj01G0151100 [Ziziphus jujuba var. spinosa]
MSDYDGNGEEYVSLRNKVGDAFDDRDSNRKRNSHVSNHERSWNREEDLERGINRDPYPRDYRDGRSVRVDKGRDKRNDNDHHQSRSHDRKRDYDYDRERRRRHRSPSFSRERSRNQSGSPSSSRTKSKRTSGFDMAPPALASLPSSASPGQLPGIPQSTPGTLQNILPFGMPQFSLPLAPAQAMTQQATRHARRVYVGGLPPMANEQTIATFFSNVMAAIGGNAAGPGDAVVNVYINHEKKFAFVEMRTVEEASNAMALDGIIFEGVAVRVRRPTDYNPTLAAALGPSQPSPHLNLAAVRLTPGGMAGAEGPDRIFVGGLPYYFTEEQIRELLQSFGPLRGFDLVKDKDTGNSKGYGFCVYQDPTVTDVACGALNGLKMGDKTLTVRRAIASTGQSRSEQENIFAQAQQHIAMQASYAYILPPKMVLQAGGVNLPEARMAEIENAESPTRVLCLTEAITADQLGDDVEYEEILEDMKDECNKFGTVVNVIIPRPSQNGEQIPGVGKVFLEYSDTVGCANARNVLNRRKFGGNIVNAVFYPEDRYYSQDYSA